MRNIKSHKKTQFCFSVTTLAHRIYVVSFYMLKYIHENKFERKKLYFSEHLPLYSSLIREHHPNIHTMVVLCLLPMCIVGYTVYGFELKIHPTVFYIKGTSGT